MKVIIKKITACYLAIVFAICCINFGYLTILDASAVTTEEKKYCEATIEDNFAPDTVLVVMSNETSLACNTYSEVDFSEIEAQSVRHITASYESDVKRAYESIAWAVKTGNEPIIADNINLGAFNQVICIELSEEGKNNVLDAIQQLEKRNDVICALPDYYWTLFSNDTDTGSEGYFQNQWAYNKIKLDDAYEEMEKYQDILSSVKVGVIDTGIDGNQELLMNNLTSNDHEYFAPYGNSDPLSDTAGHGTKVAGIIKGVCPNVELVSLKVYCDLDNSDYYGMRSSYVLEAINYARLNNIDVLNLSLGWESIDNEEFYNERYNTENGALEAVIQTYPGLIICAAGNEASGQDLDDISLDYILYPQEFTNTNLLVVGACNENDTKRVDSNYGINTVDIFAPGTGITTTATGGGTTEGNQTSMATPFVTGTAALLLSIDNTLTASELKSIILDSADECSLLDEYCEDGRRLNVEEAINESVYYIDHHSHNNVSYSNKTHSKHMLRCGTCDYSCNELHKYINGTSTGIGGHNATCLYCNFSDFYEHNWVWIPHIALYKCSVCPQTTAIIPTPGINSIPGDSEELIVALPPSDDKEKMAE